MAKDYLDALFSIADQIEEHERSDDKLSGDNLSGESLSGEELSGERALPFLVDLSSRYYKTDNEIDDILIPYISNASAQTVYRLLYRHSYGWGEHICDRLTIDDMTKLSGLSDRTISRAIDHLVKIGCIEILEESSRTAPRQYWVKLPCQIKAVKNQSKRSADRFSGDKSSGEELSGEVLTGDKSSGTDPTNCQVIQDKFSGDKLSGQVGKPFTDAGFEPQKSDENAPKDIIKDIIKDNNNKDTVAVVVDNLNMLGVTAPTAEKWIDEYGLNLVKEKLDIYRVIREREPKKIDNPPGWLATALRKDWNYPEWHFREVAKEAVKQLASHEETSG